MRLIDADELIEKYGGWYTEEGTEDGFIGTIEALVNAMPSVQPGRKTGEWLEREVHEKGVCEDIEEWQSAKCSVCGRYHTTPYTYYFSDYNFCPNCGADMREDADDIH